MKKHLRIFSLVLACVMLVGMFAACGKGASTGKDTLVVATENETPSMTTNLHNAVAGDYMNKITHNGLFKMDYEMNPVPDLAEKYELVGEDQWVITLRKGVKFHNGEEMKAADVKASLELCQKSPEVSQYGKSFTTVEVKDDYTVIIHTDGPQAGLLADLCHHGNYILPAKLIESGHDFNKEPIGTGPYKFVNWTLGEKIEFEAFADYFDGKPAIAKMVWKIIPEGSARTIALEAGDADLVIEVESLDIARLEQNDKITVLKKAGTSHNFLMLNNETAPFDNKLFRKALTAAIDREKVVEVALNNFASPSYSQLPMGFPGSSEEGGVKYDPAQAKAWLAESGVDPATVKLPIICSNDTKLRAGQVVQANLKDNLGITGVELVTMDLATYLEKTKKGEYTGSIGGYTSNTMLQQVKGVYHSDGIGASNMTRTNDPELDKMIDHASTLLDAAEQAKALEQISIYVNERNPLVPLYQNMVTRAYSSNLQGFDCSGGGNMYFDKLSWK